MKDIEIVVFNDKSWVRLVEYQKLDEELKQEKQSLAKRIYKLQSDLSKEKSKNEKLIEELEELQRENEQLKAQIEKMKKHNNCKFYHEWNTAIIMHKPLSDLSHCQGCKNFNKWVFAE